MITERQQKCITLMITTGMKQKEIAKEIKVTENTICEWKKSKEFKDEIQNQMRENFGSLAIEAQKELRALLKSKNEFVRMQAIKDILDRAGYRAIEKLDVVGSVPVVIQDDVRE